MSKVTNAMLCAACGREVHGAIWYARQAPEGGSEVICWSCYNADSGLSEKILATVEPIEPRAARPCFPLVDAVVCVECDAVYQTDPGDGCPRCGCKVGFAVSRVIAPRDAATPWRRP